MNKLFVLAAMAVLGLSPACAEFGKVVLPDEPKPWETTAAADLKSYLAKRVAGAVRVDGRPDVAFHVGDTALARAKGLLSTQLPDEQWVVRSFGTDVVLNGGGTRGALFAVSRFLEDHAGVRWWNDFEEDVPPAGPLDLPKLDATGRPAFAYREIYHVPSSGASRVLDRRVRLNGPGGAALGGSFGFGPPNACHTFEHYVPAKEHLAKHPEWFALRDGKRVGGQGEGQLCLTNPELRAFVQARMLAFIEQGIARAKKAGVPPPRIYDLSHNDNQKFCQCTNCCAAAEKFGRSGVNLNFVNPIAEAVAKRHPDVLVSTFAYQFTLEPPKGGVRAADNVLIRLCDTDSSQPASILEPENRAFHDHVIAWHRVAKHLSIWDYAIVFTKPCTGLPFASEFHYGDLFRHYRDNGVMGIFWEHEYPHKSDMWELKFWLETKLMEDPDRDCNALIGQFMREYYGAAGASILQWRRELDALRKAKGARVGWFPPIGSYAYIDPEHLASWEKLLDGAEAAVASDPKLLARVRRARTGLDRLACLRYRCAPFHDPAPGADAAKDAGNPFVVRARPRLLEDWPKWAAHWKDGAASVQAVLDDIGSVKTSAPLPPPPEFATRRFWDFPATRLTSCGSNVHAVDDAESCCGRALRTDAKDNKYAPLPYSGGVYDQAAKKTLTTRSHAKIASRPGYQWYCFGRTKVPADGYVWFSRAWTTQLKTSGYPELVGKDVEVWAHVKFTGPLYWPGATGESHIWVDRVVLLLN